MRAVLQSLFSVVGGEAAVRAANLIAVLFIARTYGGATLGAYATCLAVVTIVVMFADNGLQTSAITQLSSATDSRQQIIGQLFLSKTILLALAVVILAVIAAWMRLGSLSWTIGAWVALRTLLQSYSQLQLAVLKSASMARRIGIIQSVHSLFLVIAIWVCFREGWSVFSLLALMALCQLLELLLGIGFLQRERLYPCWPERLGCWESIRTATPFGITYGLANLIVRLDTIVLSVLVSLPELGTFSAANTILLVLYVSGWLFGSILLPEMVRLTDKPEALKLYANRWARMVALVTVPAALLLSLAAPRVMAILYGPAFAGSGNLASVMALAVPFILLNSIYASLAIASSHRSLLVGIFAAATVVTLALDFTLGIAFGSMGIASAIVLREAGMLAGFWVLGARVSSAAARCEFRVSAEGS
jgi:PST family polysaccharide transporter